MAGGSWPDVSLPPHPASANGNSAPVTSSFRRPIVTTVVPLEAFYPAEAYHQNFLVRNPTYPYIVYNDLPKVKHLEQEFPAMGKGT